MGYFLSPGPCSEGCFFSRDGNFRADERAPAPVRETGSGLTHNFGGG
jgi:hypothetical protein